VTADAGLPRVWAALSVAAALLSMIGSIVALLAPASVYGKETSFLAETATAQDIVGDATVRPSIRAWLAQEKPVTPDGFGA
jgi:hypothetical protein